MTKSKALKDMILISMFTGIIAVSSWIAIPTAVPFTLQTMAVSACICLLGTKRSTVSIAVYILLGAVGVPVFSGFRGGISALLGKTGGYIIGFIFMAVIAGIIIEKSGRKFAVMFTALIIGLAVCYIFGTAWFIFIYTKNTGNIGILAVLSMCVFPYIIPDIIKICGAIFISKRLYKYVNRS